MLSSVGLRRPSLNPITARNREPCIDRGMRSRTRWIGDDIKELYLRGSSSLPPS